MLLVSGIVSLMLKDADPCGGGGEWCSAWLGMHIRSNEKLDVQKGLVPLPVSTRIDFVDKVRVVCMKSIRVDLD